MATLSKTFSVKSGIDVANTVVIDSNRNLSNIQTLNVTTVNANTFVTGAGSPIPGTDLFTLGNTANATANLAYAQANTARNTGNTAYDQANAAYGTANTANTTGKNAYAQANTATTNAGNAYDKANTAQLTAQNAYDAANTADTDALNAYAKANSAANTVRVSANSGSTLSSKQLNFVNTATAQITVTDSGNGNANITVDVIGGGAIGQAYVQANAAYDAANTANTNALNAYAGANTANTNALNAYAAANTANTNALNAYAAANTAETDAQNAYARANAAYNTANTKVDTLIQLGAIQIGSGQTNNVWSYSINVNTASTTVVGVTKLVDSVTSTDTANAATANAVKWAYDYADSKLAKTGGTITGDLQVTGNIFLGTGNVTYVNVSSLAVNDSIIQLSTNSTSDTLDIGFVGHYSSSNYHTGLIRHAVDQKYYLFDGYGLDPTNNVIDIAGANTATLVANIQANSITLGGQTVATQANLTIASNQANAAYSQANAAYDTANTANTTAKNAYGVANTANTNAVNAYAAANTANTNAINAYGQANTATTNAGNAYDKANTAATNAVNAYDQANAAYGTANTANTIGKNAYAQANTATTNAGNAYDKANTAFTNAGNAYDAANSAYVHATDAYDRANTKVSKSGDTMTGGLTITTSGIGLSVANANVTYSLQVGTLNVTTNTVTTAAAGQVVLDKFPATQLASVKYFIQANSATNYHTTEIVLVQDATNVWVTEYGSLYTGDSLGTFTADISSGDVRLLFTAVNNINTIRSVRYGIIP